MAITIFEWFKKFNSETVAPPAPSVMRTVQPGSVAGLPEHTKPSSRVDVLKVIEDNVYNEIEAINHELVKLSERLRELNNRKKKYERILEGAKDDKYFDEADEFASMINQRAVNKWRAENGVIG